MHFCQRCDDLRELDPADDGVGASCATCGWRDPDVRVLPLLLVTGASAAGKSTLLPLLLRRLTGECVVVDVDWLIDPLTRAGRGDIDWPAFRDTWVHIAHAVAQSGLVTVLLGPFFPEQLDELPGRRWIGEIRTLVLDCDDDVRRRRITSRPGWRARDVDAQVEFGRWLRQAYPDALVDTGRTDPEAAADAVADWVRSVSRVER